MAEHQHTLQYEHIHIQNTKILENGQALLLSQIVRYCNTDGLFFEIGKRSILNQFISEKYAVCHTSSQMISIMDFARLVSRLL